ncbi:MAG: hypothetical protein WB949_02810 [Candidatus Acidiferrales bacterium]
MNANLNETKAVCTAMRILGLAGLASLALVCAGAAFAQSKPAQTAPPAALTIATAPGAQSSSSTQAATQTLAQNSSVRPPAPKGQSEGIKVHGHWTIEVKNPDGSVSTHREFENSIMQIGPELLGDIFGRVFTVGSIAIQLCNTSATTLSASGCLGASPLTLTETGSGLSNGCTTCYAVLVTPTPSRSGFSITGTVTNAPAIAINAVESDIYACYTADAQGAFVINSTFSPASCFAAAPVSGSTNAPGNHANLEAFTATAVSPAVMVTSGQSVSVTVQFSFQ